MEFVQRAVTKYNPRAPVLEVGAVSVNGSCRSLFPQQDYVGLDRRPGPGVDLVLDILEAGDSLNGRFQTVITTETLEHIIEPWRALEVMYEALMGGGLFIGTWIFAFPIHEHPVDYWRVTPMAFQFLLERAGFGDVHTETEGGQPGSPVGVFAVARRKQ